MSTRERWIVYPLLFLTLGIVLREKVIPPNLFQAQEIAAQQIHCGQLICDNAQIEQTARARVIVCDRAEAGQSFCGSFFVNGTNGRPVVAAVMDPRGHNGLIEVLSANQSPLVQLNSAPGGGMVTVVDRVGNALLMGHTGKNSGVFAHMPAAGLLIPLTQPWRFEVKPAAPSTQKGQPPASTPKKEASEKEENPHVKAKK